MEAQYESAFRTLQNGLNVGKIVVRIVAARVSAGSRGCHIVTGGTGGLGLLTGRWLAQVGTRHLILASRGGALAHDTAVEWDAVQATCALTSLERCDAGEAVHVQRFGFD